MESKWRRETKKFRGKMDRISNADKRKSRSSYNNLISCARVRKLLLQINNLRKVGGEQPFLWFQEKNPHSLLASVNSNQFLRRDNFHQKSLPKMFFLLLNLAILVSNFASVNFNQFSCSGHFSTPMVLKQTFTSTFSLAISAVD